MNELIRNWLWKNVSPLRACLPETRKTYPETKSASKFFTRYVSYTVDNPNGPLFIMRPVIFEAKLPSSRVCWAEENKKTVIYSFVARVWKVSSRVHSSFSPKCAVPNFASRFIFGRRGNFFLAEMRGRRTYPSMSAQIFWPQRHTTYDVRVRTIRENFISRFLPCVGVFSATLTFVITYTDRSYYLSSRVPDFYPLIALRERSSV